MSTRIVKIKSDLKIKCGEDFESLDLIYCLNKCKLLHLFWKIILLHLLICVSEYSINSISVYTPNTNICTGSTTDSILFIEALLIRVKNETIQIFNHS